ncbi:uncharacterized protein LOC125877300 [Solanum stenotomum]|uniref:uncharacterized protein LOC125877300 n=1 Tax=Solanum stenotomum TaxID=172797 RepID=UPI0020D17C02|nr:uncharacterized protein LOC125877300 [Solanum stenotomum]
MGDFNFILAQEDRIVGSQVQDEEIRDFKECVTNSNLVELQIGGRNYTWTNGHIYSRIDKARVNADWLNKMATQQVIAIEPLFLDHSPLGLIMGEQRDTKKRPFKFYNCIGQHPEFRNRVEASWHILGEGMKGIRMNLKIVRKKMKKIIQKDFMGVSEKVQALGRELIDKQKNIRVGPIPQANIDEEKLLRTKLAKWSMIEENIYKQKS